MYIFFYGIKCSFISIRSHLQRTTEWHKKELKSVWLTIKMMKYIFELVHFWIKLRWNTIKKGWFVSHVCKWKQQSPRSSCVSWVVTFANNLSKSYNPILLLLQKPHKCGNCHIINANQNCWRFDSTTLLCLKGTKGK